MISINKKEQRPRLRHMSAQNTRHMKRSSQSKKKHWFRTWNREQRQETINIWNITPNPHTNSHPEMWAEKWTITQEASGPSTAPNAARRISRQAWNTPADHPQHSMQMRSTATCPVRHSKSKTRGQKHPREVVKNRNSIPNIKVNT